MDKDDIYGLTYTVTTTTVMSLEGFEHSMKALKKFYTKELSKLDKILDILSDEGGKATFGMDFMDDFIDLLAITMGGTEEIKEWISWFVLDNDFGKAKRTMKMGEELIKVKSVKDLYNILVNL